MKSLDLEKLWNWLPTYRVVAERENVQEAARMLRLSASSISRTIRLLETELGRPLFERRAGRLRLNPAGNELLEAVRRSMRIVDDGVTAVRGLDAIGPLRLSAPRDLIAPLVLPAIARMRENDPSTRVFLRSDADAPAVASGIVDLALVFSASGANGVEVHRLGAVSFGVYCGREHPLWSSEVSSLDALRSHGFIVTEHEPAWPAEFPRNVVVEAHDPATSLDACVGSLGLAVLPDAFARAAISAGSLRRVSGADLRPCALFALRRPFLAADRAATIITDLADALKS